jgi:hypothetical protein
MGKRHTIQYLRKARSKSIIGQFFDSSYDRISHFTSPENVMEPFCLHVYASGTPVGVMLTSNEEESPCSKCGARSHLFAGTVLSAMGLRRNPIALDGPLGQSIRQAVAEALPNPLCFDCLRQLRRDSRSHLETGE